ncbi:MAG: acyltransferase [Desulfamplus sp.]|nr:acyltransferase [Desulfamplus sp.]
MDKNKKNIEIQFLRVIAIVMVLMMHAAAGMFNPYAETYNKIVLAFIHPAVGVDIFFVISGYLMGVTFLGKTADVKDMSEKISLTSKFYLRRFWRLFPASFFWATLTLIVGLISTDTTGIWFDSKLYMYKAWVASVLCFRNFLESLHATHLGYYWSLSLENQFYLLLPIAWFFLLRKWFWKVAGLLCVLCIFWRPGGSAWWFFRFDGLLMGMIIYKLTSLEAFRNAVRLISPETRIGKILMTSFLCLAIPSVPNSIGAYPSLTWSIVALLSSILVCQAVLNEGYIYIPTFLTRPIYWFGEFSYAIYLCHLPVFFLFKDIIQHYVNPDGRPYLMLITGITELIAMFLCAALTYWGIEQPCQKIGYKKLKQGVNNKTTITTKETAHVESIIVVH